MITQKLDFRSKAGHFLAARLDLPSGAVRGWCVFAHCFTCGKDIAGARRIAGELARLGVAVLRFDFTGLGSSGGEFANSGFAADIDDIVAAADHLRTHFGAPSLLVGHSLGGLAVLAAARHIPEVKGVVTIGAPADAAHVLKHFSPHLDEIRQEGSAEVAIAGRPFRIGASLVDQAKDADVLAGLRHMRTALMIMHSPVDDVVGIDNASRIFVAARHPKSFVSLDQADHLLSREADAAFAAQMIAAWAGKFLPADVPQGDAPTEAVTVSETRAGRFQNNVRAGRHRLFADEPVSYGGDDTGPSPYDFLSMALGACTSMTLRMYADRKGIVLPPVTVIVSHEKVHTADCADCTDETRARGGRIDVFVRTISVAGPIPADLSDKLVEIAGKCPVHRTLEQASHVRTTVKTGAT